MKKVSGDTAIGLLPVPLSFSWSDSHLAQLNHVPSVFKSYANYVKLLTGNS